MTSTSEKTTNEHLWKKQQMPVSSTKIDQQTNTNPKQQSTYL